MKRLCTLLLLLAGFASLPASAFTLGQQGFPGFRDHDPKVLERAGVVPWETLRELEISYESKGPGMTDFKSSFTTALLDLDGKEVKLAGFIYPLEAAEAHERFLLAAYPPSCPFCLPGGATEMVEVLAKPPVRFTYDAIVLAGRFELLRDDPSGLLYRLHDARTVTLN
jgi:hypothetical protein